MGTSELFKRFVGSAPGYERRPLFTKGRALGVSTAPEQAPNVHRTVDKYPIIRKGKIVGWQTF